MRRAWYLCLLAAALPIVARGQDNAATRQAEALARRADGLLATGQIFRAESLYYDAVRIAPRDPVARAALGGYLADRGALRVGAILLEEARDFGADSVAIAVRLAPILGRLQDAPALLALMKSPLTPAERERAAWLTRHPSLATVPDSVVVPLVAIARDPLGRIRVVVGADTVDATIDQSVSGLWLDTSWAHSPAVQLFPGRGSARPIGVAESIRIGGLALTSVPVVLASTVTPHTARLGLDVLEGFTPTFAPRAGTLTLRQRAAGSRTSYAPGDTLPILMRPNGIAVFRITAGVAAAPGGLVLLAGHQWTLDWRNGEVVVGP